MGIDEASNWTSGRYMWYCPEMYSNDLTQDPCVRMRFRLDCSSSNGKQDGEDKVQYSEIDHLAMVPAKAPIRMHLGQSGQSGQYGENHEPRLKTSERPDLHAGSAPCTDPWTAVYHSLFLQKDLSSNPMYIYQKEINQIQRN